MEAAEQIKRFQEFIEGNYYAKLLEALRKENKFLVIDFMDLAKFDPDLANELLDNPEETIKAAELSIEQFDLEKDVKGLKARFKNLPESQKIMIRDIRSKHIGKLMLVEGIVKQKSDVRPQVTAAKFECPSCGNIINILQLEGSFREPSRCGCGRKGKFILLSKELVDAQGIVLEEVPESLEGGEQPKRINIFLKDDLVSPISERRTCPGSKISIVGLIKEVPIILRSGSKSTRFDLLIEANFIEAIEETFYEVEISEEEEKKIKELAQDPRVYQKLINSIAPSIYGFDKIKEALLLQLMGGVRKVRKDKVVSRGDMHILLVGDPGSGKSALLKRISLVAPKGRYVSGRGVSGAGITAAVVRDEFLRGWSLEAGALVLASNGICVTGDTEILATGNKVYTIKQVMDKFKKGERIKVKCLDYPNFNIKEFFVKNVTKRMPERLFSLEFDTGDILKITEEHPILTWDNGFCWKKVRDLKEGAIVATPLCVPSEERAVKLSEVVDCSLDGFPEYLDEDLMEFLGLVISDGNISNKKYKISFYTKDEELKDKFCKLSSILFQKKAKIYLDKRWNVYQVYFYSKNVHTFLQQMGIKRGNKSKQIMSLDKIYNLPNTKIKSFLVGVINGDGSISNRKGGGCIDIVTGLKENAEWYRKLFRKLGIISKVKEIKTFGGWIVKKGNYKVSKLTITGISNLAKIYDERLLTRKFNVLKNILEREDKSWDIPKIDNLFENIRDMLPHTKKALLYRNSIKICLLKGGFGIKRKKLKRALDILRNVKNIKVSKEYKILEDVYNNQLYFTKIVKKENILIEEVYNLEVDHDCEPNYFANFIPVHNCMIDEMDKMVPEDRAAMHEALEQQTVSISKANIQATLLARTTVLAAANPKFGRFDPYGIIADQIDLPPTLINRFDLIFPIKDLPEETKDKQMADHILSLHQTPDLFEAEISTDLLKKYIAYAKQKITPKLTDVALEEIKDFYLKMRLSGGGEGGIRAIPISPRQLEALVRLSEASAKVRLSDKVTKKDAKKAIELLEYCLMQVGFDKETGKIDIDRIATGITASQRSHISSVKEIIAELESKIGKTIPIDDIISEASARDIAEEQVEEAIEKLKRSGDLFEPRRGFISRI